MEPSSVLSAVTLIVTLASCFVLQAHAQVVNPPNYPKIESYPLDSTDYIIIGVTCATVTGIAILLGVLYFQSKKQAKESASNQVQPSSSGHANKSK